MDIRNIAETKDDNTSAKMLEVLENRAVSCPSALQMKIVLWQAKVNANVAAQNAVQQPAAATAAPAPANVPVAAVPAAAPAASEEVVVDAKEQAEITVAAAKATNAAAKLAVPRGREV